MIHLILKPKKTKSILWFVCLSSILLVGCKTQEVQTHWSSAPVKVDGKMDDWTNAPMLYFEESGVQLGLRNDSENLYILFRFKNDAWAQAIRMGGVNIWFDNSGKKNKERGIRYTGGPSFFDFQKMKPSNEGGFEESLTPEQKQRFSEREKTMAMADQIVTIDKKGNPGRRLATDGSDGPAVSYDSSQGACTYEFSLPLQNGDVSRYGIGIQPGQMVSLGLEWGGVSMPDRKSGRGNPGGGMGGGPPGGGMGGGPPGGMGGGPPGGGMGGGPPGGSSDNKASEKQELWLKTKLAIPSTQ